jgi:hypothetical protein
MQEAVDKLIAEAKALGSVSLDLSFKELKKLPDELLQLTQLEVIFYGSNPETSHKNFGCSICTLRATI